MKTSTIVALMRILDGASLGVMSGKGKIAVIRNIRQLAPAAENYEKNSKMLSDSYLSQEALLDAIKKNESGAGDEESRQMVAKAEAEYRDGLNMLLEAEEKIALEHISESDLEAFAVANPGIEAGRLAMLDTVMVTPASRQKLSKKQVR
jgi:hypothetical protein